MTHEQYERHKQRLDAQLDAGIRLLRSAHQAQIRALDVVWMLQAEEAPEGATAPEGVASSQSVSSPEAPSRLGIGELDHDLRVAFLHLPERFTRGDVCAALGYRPERGMLYRLLQELVQEGSLQIETLGTGRKATVYRKTGVPKENPAA